MRASFIKSLFSLFSKRSTSLLILMMTMGWSSHAADKPVSFELDTKAHDEQIESIDKPQKRSAVPNMLFNLNTPRKERVIPKIPKEHIILRFDENDFPTEK